MPTAEELKIQMDEAERERKAAEDRLHELQHLWCNTPVEEHGAQEGPLHAAEAAFAEADGKYVNALALWSARR